MELTEQNQRRRAIWLSVSLVAILAAMHFPKWLGPEPDLAENRVLVSFPAWPADAAGWMAFPKAVDAYVQDRFPARGRLIAWLNLLRYRVGDSGSSRVIVGRHGWLFYDDGSQLGAARASIPLTDAEAARWVRTLAARTQRLAQQDVTYLVLVPPMKERVYPEHAPAWFVDGGPETDALRLSREARDAGHDTVVYLLPDVLRAKYESPPAYSRFDTHWTGFGAHRAYLALADRLRGSKAEIEAWPIERYRQLPMQPHAGPRDLGLMLGIAGFVRQEYPQHEFSEIGREPKATYLTERHDWTGDRVIDTGRPGPVLLWTGDSFSNELLPFLYPHFSRMVVAHNQEGYFREDLIAAYKPDVVVTEVLESGVRHAMNPSLEPMSAATATAPPEPLRFRMETREEAAARRQDRAGGPCNLEIAALRRNADGGGALHLEGWMFDGGKNRAAAQTVVLVLGEDEGPAWRLVVPNVVARQDVAAHFGKSAAATSGFNATVDLEAPIAQALSRAGPIRFAMRQQYDGEVVTCAFERAVDPAG